ncbi:hypothetical protein HC891_19685 [Candidatus Gracilibacteria bacterium]|nr:hypothetical protein [Candidatus Gracilibacteria bacterium]
MEFCNAAFHVRIALIALDTEPLCNLTAILPATHGTIVATCPDVAAAQRLRAADADVILVLCNLAQPDQLELLLQLNPRAVALPVFASIAVPISAPCCSRVSTVLQVMPYKQYHL